MWQKTEAKAMEEGRDHILFYFQKLLRTTPEINLTAGTHVDRPDSEIIDFRAWPRGPR